MAAIVRSLAFRPLVAQPAREQGLTATMLLGGGLIIVAVVLVVRRRGSPGH
jgi:hypothetical protein